MRRSCRFQKRGYALPELLAAVCIAVILLAAAAPDILGAAKRLRLKQLDSSAADVYMSVQSELSSARLAGLPLDFGGRAVPIDAASYKSALGLTGEIFPAAVILSRCGGSCAVEYDLNSGAVYGVFYGLGGINYDPSAAWSVPRGFAERLLLPIPVGYYGGAGFTEPEASAAPVPVIEIINGDVLGIKVTADCAETVGFSLSLSSGGVSVDVVPESAGCRISGGGSAAILLDSLLPFESGEKELPPDGDMTGFTLVYDLKNRGDAGLAKLLGGDITVEAEFHLEGRAASRSYASVNGLFESFSGGEAVISCGRHLQNLGYLLEIPELSSVKLINDIDFSASGYEFTPIDASAGLSGGFFGNGHTIKGLRVNGASDSEYGAGLFSSIMGCGKFCGVIFDSPEIYGGSEPSGAVCGYAYGAEFEDIKVISPTVRAVGSAGGVAGMCAASSADGVFVYSDGENYDSCGIYAEGEEAYAGGYFGYAGGVAISGGGASVKVRSEYFAGGLIGYAGAGCTVVGSYVGGRTKNGKFCGEGYSLVNVYGGSGAGGFVGNSKGIDFTGCYTTCSLGSGDPSCAEAFVGEGEYSASECYTLSVLIDENGAAEAPLRSGGISARPEEVDISLRADALPYDGFIKESCGGKYPYPCQSVHIGDWQEKDRW